jgi:hypothetical protein
LTQFDRTLCGIVLIVPPCDVVFYEIERSLRRLVRCFSLVLNSNLLQPDEGFLPRGVKHDVPNEVVKFADWTFATLTRKLHSFGRDLTLQLEFKCFYVRAEEDLISHEVDNVPYTQHVTLARVEGKLIC